MITPEIIAETARLLAARGCDEAAVQSLRQLWPNLRFTACSDDDVPPRLTPVHEGEGYRLYLIGGGEHCLALTTSAEAAIGLVVAAVADDD